MHTQPVETGDSGKCETDFRGQCAERKPPLDHPHKEDGGARRDRTDDLMLAKHALSQLSYGPF